MEHLVTDDTPVAQGDEGPALCLEGLVDQATVGGLGPRGDVVGRGGQR